MAPRTGAILVAAWVTLTAAAGTPFLSTMQTSVPATTEAPVEIATSAMRAGTTPMPASTDESTTNATDAMSTAAKTPCTGNNDMVNLVVAISPDCFEQCPYLCGALEALVTKFSANPDQAAIEKEVCLAKEEYGCAFNPGHLAACKAVISAGANFNVPQTGAELSRRCSAAAGGAAQDSNLFGFADVSAARPWTVVKAAPLLLAWAVHML